MLFSLLAVVACNEPLSEVPVEEADGPLVKVALNVQLPEALLTKAMGYTPSIESVWVVEFGAAGYFKRWAKAEPKDSHISDNGTAGGKAYTVELPISGADQRFHIIAGYFSDTDTPETYTGSTELEVINSLETSGGDCAYWQRIVVPGGIRGIKQVDGSYRVTTESQAYFNNIPLVRNFAKVAVENVTRAFSIVRYALINVPSSGKVAPYDAATHAFVDGYSAANVGALNFTTLYNGGNGYKPQDVSIAKTTSVSNLTFKTPSDTDPYLYLYERPIPTADPTCLLVELRRDGNNYEWFKIEILNETRYVPVYRDFTYKVNIFSIDGEGEVSTTQGDMTAAQKALDGPAFGDVSASLETAGLTTVSDASSSLAVGYTDYISVSTTTTSVSLPYVFTTTESGNSPTVTIELRDAGSGAVLSTFTGVTDQAVTSGTEYSISVPLAAAGGSLKKSMVRVSAKASSTSRELYRDVYFRVMGKVDFESSSSISGGASLNNDVTLTLVLPEDLGSSIFPLTFHIEASDNSLSATDSDLPVQTGASPLGTGKNTFWFTKTIAYSDYYNRTTKEYTTSFDCHFKRNKTVTSGTTTVSVMDPGAHFNTKTFTL